MQFLSCLWLYDIRSYFKKERAYLEKSKFKAMFHSFISYFINFLLLLSFKRSIFKRICKTISDIVQFSSSGEHTYAIDNQGKLLAWGRNEDGELGSEDGINRSVPSPVVSMSSDTFKQVTTGRFGSLAIKTDGTVVSWQSKKIKVVVLPLKPSQA